MCTAIAYKTRDHYFGRNLDLERSYQERVVITPRNYSFAFRKMGKLSHHYAMIGMAAAVEGYPLYYEATNEKGLSVAGLNFPGEAVYQAEKADMDNVTPFELIPWLLGQCATLKEARERLKRINLLDQAFSAALPLSPLHWIVSDRTGAITVEPMGDGLRIYDNPVGVLTNNPPFPYHLYHLNDYMNLTSDPPVNRFAAVLPLKPYSLGQGGMGLPGDLSSASRFVKAAFTLHHSRSGEGESESVSQFFHILGSVAQQRGCVCVRGEEYEYTLYSSCCNTDRGVYYYTTYENSQITAVDMHREDLEGDAIVCYALIKGQQIRQQN